jgi:hypothetical protein
MSNARIQFSLASEDVWNAYNPQLKEGEIVTVLKANKKVKLVQGKVGGSTYSESTVIWDEDTAETIMSRAEAAAVTATAQAAAASGSASKAAASQSAAATSATNAKASENAAKTSATSAASSASSASTASTQAGKAADSASASKEAAQSAATTASNYASAARSSASEAKAYMDTTKDLSENVNVFVPTVDADGTLTWTNKAGLSNPAAVNIKGAKGDPGPQGPKGDEVTIDEELSATSVNPVQNKIVKVAIDNVTDSIPKTSIANTWTAQQNFYNLMLSRETYSNFDIVSGSDTPITSTMIYPSVTSTFTLNLSKLAGKLRPNQTTVFTAYFIGNGNYPLIITDAGTIKYIGSASDVAVTPYGMLLNILMVTDGGGTLTSIVQASKLEGGA